MEYDHRTNDPDVTFTYDDLDRLTDVDYFQGTDEVFAMDDLGNRDVVAVRSGDDEDYIIDANTNRYAFIDSNDLTYDAAGNLTKDKDGYLYSYDYENRLYYVTRTDLSPVASYAYDAMGRRISKYEFSTNPATVTFYYHNAGWQVLAEYEYNWSLNQQDFARRYVYGNYIDEALLMTDASDDDYYYAHDHLYSVTALMDDTGAVVERYEYNAYGDCNVSDADFTTDADQISDHNNPYRFTGRRLDVLDDGNLEVQYSRMRYYKPDMGRFLTGDPMEYVDGMNMYEYGKSNPCGNIDAYGLRITPIPFPSDSDVTGMKYLAILSIVNMRGIHEEYDYYELSGFGRTLSKIETALRAIPSWKYSAAAAEGNPTYNFRSNRMALPPDLDTTGYDLNVLHEGIHAYIDSIAGFSWGLTRNEGLAYAVESMYPSFRHFKNIEDELKKEYPDEPDKNLLNSQWRNAWIYIDVLTYRTQAGNSGVVNMRHVSDAKRYMGFSFSCQEFADRYNQIAHGWCLNFTCETRNAGTTEDDIPLHFNLHRFFR